MSLQADLASYRSPSSEALVDSALARTVIDRRSSCRSHFKAQEHLGTAFALSTCMYTLGTHGPLSSLYQVVECGSGPL